MEPTQLMQLGLRGMTMLTFILMIVATAVPKWYVSEYDFDIGIWRFCYLSCHDITNATGGIVSARAFTVVAILMVFVASIFCIVIDRNVSGAMAILKVPRILLAIAGVFYAIAIGSFIAWVGSGFSSFSYGTTFYIAWICVVTSFMSATLAHVNHTRLAATAQGH